MGLLGAVRGQKKRKEEVHKGDILQQQYTQTS